MVDKENRGFVIIEMLKPVLDQIHRGTVSKRNEQSIALFEYNQPDLCTWQEWVELNNAFPQILSPMFENQISCMLIVCGKRFWMAKRYEMWLEKRRERERIARLRSKQQAQLGTLHRAAASLHRP